MEAATMESGGSAGLKNSPRQGYAGARRQRCRRGPQSRPNRSARLMSWSLGCAARAFFPFVTALTTEVTHIVSTLPDSDPHPAGCLLPLVYEELRRLAAVHLAREPSGQT